MPPWTSHAAFDLPAPTGAAAGHATCWLTRWRDHEGLPSFQRNAHFALALLHARVHEAGKRALRLRAVGDDDGSRHAAEEMERTLAQALELIDAVGRGLHGEPRRRKPAASPHQIAHSVIDRLTCGGEPLRPAAP